MVAVGGTSVGVLVGTSVGVAVGISVLVGVGVSVARTSQALPVSFPKPPQSKINAITAAMKMKSNTKKPTLLLRSRLLYE